MRSIWDYLPQIGLCEIEINSSKLEVSVADNSALVVSEIIGLNSLKCSSHGRRVVGLDLKITPTGKVLILCVGAHCLIIKLSCLVCVPKALKQFLADETFCFLGTGMSNIVQALQYDDIQCGTGIEVGYLFARILRKPNIEGYGLKELADEVGMHIEEAIGECADWNAIVFSMEQIKYAVHNASTSYVIVDKLLRNVDFYSDDDDARVLGVKTFLNKFMFVLNMG